MIKLKYQKYPAKSYKKVSKKHMSLCACSEGLKGKMKNAMLKACEASVDLR